jgi:hypothetical protein
LLLPTGVCHIGRLLMPKRLGGASRLTATYLGVWADLEEGLACTDDNA